MFSKIRQNWQDEAKASLNQITMTLSEFISTKEFYNKSELFLLLRRFIAKAKIMILLSSKDDANAKFKIDILENMVVQLADLGNVLISKNLKITDMDRDGSLQQFLEDSVLSIYFYVTNLSLEENISRKFGYSSRTENENKFHMRTNSLLGEKFFADNPQVRWLIIANEANGSSCAFLRNIVISEDQKKWFEKKLGKLFDISFLPDEKRKNHYVLNIKDIRGKEYIPFARQFNELNEILHHAPAKSK